MAQSNITKHAPVSWGTILLCAALAAGQAGENETARDNPNPLTVALVVAPGGGEAWQAIEAKLLAALSAEDIQLVERQQLQAVLDEVRLAMVEVTESGSAEALAKLAGADVFVFIEPKLPPRAVARKAEPKTETQSTGPPDDDPPADHSHAEPIGPTLQCHLRAVETRTGIVLGQLLADSADLAKEITPAVLAVTQSLAKARAPAADRRYVAVLGFQSEESGESLRPLAKSLKQSLAAALGARPEVVLLEREQLRLLAREEALAGASLDMQASPMLLLGGVHRDNGGLKVSVRMIPLAGGEARTVTVIMPPEAMAEAVTALREKITTALADGKGQAATSSLQDEADALRRRMLYLARLREWDDATMVGEALVVLHPSKQNLEAMMTLLLVRWPEAVYMPFDRDSPPWSLRETGWYESQELYYLSTRMMEVEERLCAVAEELGEEIAYRNVDWLRFRRFQECVSYQFLPFSSPGQRKLEPPADPLLRRRFDVLAGLSRDHHRAKLSYRHRLKLSPTPLAWQLQFAARLAADADECDRLVKESLADLEAFKKEWVYLPASMLQSCPWVLTVAEQRFGHQAVAPTWRWLKAQDNPILQAGGYFGQIQAGGDEAHSAAEQLAALARNAELPVQQRAGLLSSCLEIRRMFEPRYGRDILSGESWRRHQDARDRLAGLAAREGIELTLASLAHAASDRERGAILGVLGGSVAELSRMGDLAEHLGRVFGQELANQAWGRLASAPVVLETAIRHLGRSEVDDLIALLNGVSQPAPSTEDADAHAHFVAAMSQCRRLQASLARRLLPTEAGPLDGAGQVNPWDMYGLQEIPIANVPKEYAGGYWDNIILDGDQLILIWQNGHHCYISTLPVTGGELRQLAKLDAPDPSEHSLMRPIHWAAVLDDTLYVGRSWGADRWAAYRRVLKGEPPVPADWPALLVIEDGEVVKSYSEADGLPGRSINTMAAFDGRIYFGVDYRRLTVVEDKDMEGFVTVAVGFKPGALACFGPATESFEVIASSRRVAPRNELDGGAPWGVTDILPDPKRDCLWLRIAEITPDHANPGAPIRNGMWRYESKQSTLEVVDHFPGAMQWFDADRLCTIGLNLLSADTGRIEVFGPDRPYDRTFTLPGGGQYGRIGKGLNWPFGEGQVRYFGLGDYVLDGLVLCDPQTDRAYPYPRGGFGLTSDFSFLLPADGGILVADRADFRLYRIARKQEGASQAAPPTPQEEMLPPAMPPALPPPPKSKSILVLRTGRYHILNTETGELSPTGYYNFRGEHPQRAFSEGLAAVKQESLKKLNRFMYSYGLIDESGEVIMPLEQFQILPFKEGLAVAADGGAKGETFKWGFVGRKGQWAIPAQFDGARSFSNGRAAVNLGSTYMELYPGKNLHMGGTWRFCDRQGSITTPIGYQAVQDYSEGLAAVHRSPYGWGYIDLDGKTVIRERYGTARPFQCGVAWVSQKDELRYSVVPGMKYYVDAMVEYSEAYEPFWQRKQMPALRGRWRLIDRTGRYLTKDIEGQITDFHEDLAWFKPGDQRWGCLDTTGRVVIETRFSAPLPFSEGLARVGWNLPNGRFGFVDRQGRLAITPQFSAADSFSEGLAAVCVGGDVTYGKDDYNVVHKPVGGRWGYVNRRGEWVFPPQFEQAGAFIDGVARVVKSGRVIYIDRSGRVIYDAGSLWSTTGSAISQVAAGSWGEQLGFLPGDMILRIGDRDIVGLDSLHRVDYTETVVYYVGRDGEAFIGVVPPGDHGLSAPIDMDYWRQPSTITPEIATDTPPIERTDAPITAPAATTN